MKKETPRRCTLTNAQWSTRAYKRCLRIANVSALRRLAVSSGGEHSGARSRGIRNVFAIIFCIERRGARDVCVWVRGFYRNYMMGREAIIGMMDGPRAPL